MTDELEAQDVPVNAIQKLTNWKDEPKISDFKHDLQQTLESHSRHVTNLARWEKNFKGEHLPEKQGNNHNQKQSSRIQPRLISKQAEWRCPALSEPLLSAYDLFKVDPLTHEDKNRAIQNELILNNQFSTQINKVRFVDSLIRTLVKEGTAIIRLGWDYQSEEIKTVVPQFQYQVVADEMMEQFEPYIQMMQQEPDSFSQLDPALQESIKQTMAYQRPIVAQQVGQQESTEEHVIANKPTLDICNSQNVYIDPTCEGDMSKAQFVIHSFESTLSDLRRTGQYKNLDSIMLESAESANSAHHTYSNNSFTFKDKPRKKITVYEYWGYRAIDDTGIVKPILATWVGDVLIRLEENPFPDQKIPFVVIPYIPQARSVYGIPDGELLEDNQKILGAVTRGVIDLLGKSANSQTGTAKGLLDATNRIRFAKGEDYEYNPNLNPQSHIYTHTYPEASQSALWLINQVNNDAEAISGVKAFSGQGITGAGLGDTAAGVRSAMDAASKREMSVLRRISEGVIEIGRRIISMNSEFLSEEEVVRITNSEFVTVRREDLAGNFDLRLTISTAEADEAKAKELAFMLQTMGNNIDPEMSKMILSEIARLRKMPDLAHQIQTFQPQPDPMQQQIQQLEMQKLQMEIALLQAQAQEAGSKGTLNSAKVNVEQARAESLQGDADLKTQTFVDNQTGVAHDREMQKKTMDADTALQGQRLKNEGNLENQITQFGLNKQDRELQHKSDLLKLKASHDLQPKNSTS